MDYSLSGSSRGAGISMIPSPRDQPYHTEGRAAAHFPSSSGFSHHGAAGRRELPPQEDPLPSAIEVDVAWSDIMNNLHAFHRSARTHGASRVAPPRPPPPPALRSSLMIRGGGPTEEWKPVPSYHEMVKERLGLAQKKGEVQVQDRWLSCLLARRTNRVRCTFFAAFRKIVSKEKSVRRHLASRRRRDEVRAFRMLRMAASKMRIRSAFVRRKRAAIAQVPPQ
ncbi:hypothetical protein T484DRAFT_1913717 [Baffinella frigidus]|nr:hypothetical protein T484DRAFT_1913717 [Cryptophyta sp. CCMP2293]